MLDVKIMSNIINELRLKINIIMAGDYGWEDEDVKIACKLNEISVKKGDFSTYR